ncbi:MAG: radical SAM protein [Candidatus Fermentibacteraceae bacterium]
MSRGSAQKKYDARRRAILDSERCLQQRNEEGVFETVLASPKVYSQGMASIEYQSILGHLSRWPDTRCERAFFPEKDELNWRKRSERSFVTLDSGSPIERSDLIVFHIGHESDYEYVLQMMQLSGLEIWGERRQRRWPLLIGTGITVTANPLPLAPFLDAFIVGETEPALGPVLDTIKSLGAQGASKRKILRWIAQLPGIYVPSHHGYRDVKTTIMRQWAGADTIGTRTCVFAPQSDLGPVMMLEIARGCPFNCRFCMGGYIYLPYREKRLEDLQEAMDDLEGPSTIGLLGCAPEDHAMYEDIVDYARRKGHSVITGSLRPEDLGQLRNLPQDYSSDTLVIAPETGSDSLRRVIGKNLDNATVLRRIESAGEKTERIRLYFMIGLPFETAEDRRAIPELVAAAREITDLPISVYITPFIPRPWTAFQWTAMTSPRKLRIASSEIEPLLDDIEGVKTEYFSPRDAHIIGLLARGDHRVSKALEVRLTGVGWNTAFGEAGININWIFHDLKPGSPFQWDFLNMGFGYTRLARELQLAVSANQTRIKKREAESSEEQEEDAE